MLGRKILVVDDEDHICRVVAFKLRAAGYRVTTASDAESAIELARNERPDLVITDYQMPGMSGLDLCRAVQAGGLGGAAGDVPALLLTARNYELNEASTNPANVRRVVSKPFSPRNLVQAVRETLGEAA